MLVDRHAPAQLFALAGQVSRFVPMLRTLGVKLPPQLPQIPGSIDEVKLLIQRELYTRPAAELAGILQLAEATVGAWLAEYEATQPAPVPTTPEETETPHGDSSAPSTAE